MGLDKDDTIVRRRMAQKMEFLAEDVSAAHEPTTEELKAWFAKNTKLFTQPARVTFRHLYFSPDRRGKSAWPDAKARSRQARGQARGLGGRGGPRRPVHVPGLPRRPHARPDRQGLRPALREGALRPEAGRVDRPDRVGLRLAPRLRRLADARARLRPSRKSSRTSRRRGWRRARPRPGRRRTRRCGPSTSSSCPRRRRPRPRRRPLDEARRPAVELRSSAPRSMCLLSGVKTIPACIVRLRRLAPLAALAALLAQGCATATRRQAVPLHLETQAVVSGFPDGIRYFPRDAAQLKQFEEDFVESWKLEQAYRRARGLTGRRPRSRALFRPSWSTSKSGIGPTTRCTWTGARRRRCSSTRRA